MNTRNQPAESLGYYPSKYITGRSRSTSKIPAAVCLKESVIAEFWREAVRAIDRKSDSDVDGRVYASIDIDVYLGPYDITIRHNYKWEAQRGGDSYCGIWEPYAELEESFEVVGAHDYDCNESLPGVVYVLNQYYKDHENEILNRR